MFQNQMKPLDYSDIMKRRKWSLILPFLIILMVSAIIALALPPIYKSTSTILIEQQEIPQDFVMSAINTYAEQQMQIINQRIMSAPRLIEIIKRFDLYQDLRTRWTTEEILEKMREDIKLEPISVETVDRRTGRSAVATIAFTLSFEGKSDPIKVQRVSTVLSSLFLEENAQIRVRQASELSVFLEDEMKKVKSDLADIDNEIALFKEKHVNALPELLQVNMQHINNIESNIEVMNDQLRRLREQESVLKSQLAGISPDFLEADKKRLEELKVHLVFLSKRFSDEYPDVIKTKAEISELEQNIEEKFKINNPGKLRPDNPAYITIASQLASVQSDIDSMQGQISELNKRKEEYIRRIEATPRVEEEYKTMMVERNNTQAKYDDLMRKLMEARVSQGLEKEQKGERFTLIEPASLPEKPYKPNRMAIMLIGLVLGIGTGIGSASLKEYTDDSIRTSEDLKRVTSSPVLASIPLFVSAEEILRRKKRITVIISAAGATFLSCIVLFHFFVMNLDIFWLKLLRRLGI